MGDVQPINLLIDELKSEDITLRLNAIKRLSTIAVALGPERTRGELIPFLADSIDDEDEILTALGEQLSQFVPFVGGPDYAMCLLPPLETLATMEETIVRDQSCEALNAIAGVLSDEHHTQHFVPLTQRLATGDWFTSKVSACYVMAAAYAKASPQARTALRTSFKALCEDDSPLVRRAASLNLAKVAKVVESENFDTMIVPTFLRLAEDEQDSVRLLAVENCVEIAKLVSKEKAARAVLPTFKNCAQAKSWRVRYMVADNFTAMCEALEQALVAEQMVEVFVRLLYKETESEAEVRTAGARKVTEFAKLVPKEVVSEELVPAVVALASDTSQHVRSALASVVMGLAPICGREQTMENLLPLYLQLLKDDIPEVRLNIISNVEAVSSVIGVETLSQSLLPAIMELASDKQWRVRLAIIEYIPLLAEQLGVEFFDEKLAELCFSWLGDCVYTIREASINNLKRLTTIFGTEWADKHIVPKVVSLKEHNNYLYRMTALYAASTLAEVVGADITTASLTPMVIELADDAVPNIRFNVCKTLAAIVTVVDAGSAVATDQIKPALTKLQDDTDVDVKHFAAHALTLFGGQ